MLILTRRCFIHGHAISRKKKHIRHLLATDRPWIFAPHFFTIEDVSLLEKLKHETKIRQLQLRKVLFIGREGFAYFEYYIKNQ